MTILTAIFLLCYILIPGGGGVFQWYRWFRWRRRFYGSLLFPLWSPGKPLTGREWRFLGTVDSLVRDHYLWVRCNGLLVWVDLSRVLLHLLPGVEEDRLGGMEVLHAEDVHHLPSGASVYLAGRVREENGKIVLDPQSQPVLVLYSVPLHNLVHSVISSARSVNEFWNPLTLPFMGVGMLLLLLFGSVSIQTHYLEGLLSLTAAFLPVSVFFPPAVFGYYLHRKLWKMGKKALVTYEQATLPWKACRRRPEEGTSWEVGDRRYRMREEGASFVLEVREVETGAADPLLHGYTTPPYTRPSRMWWKGWGLLLLAALSLVLSVVIEGTLILMGVDYLMGG
ncbi:hypothetical protein Spith_1729 [Spirochaeta thermophila DSM 6578]|uniref:Uncharacterized protein n=1 Tax=Winmispira thermophila (strain ATCC 700085 / DSM 6578 / Z-1203) TaxID=869211 RepID=G0GBX8_WINT7|nr:hypothetical protein [Spirochaeta thermophila]AEJ61989.1 hypothetical protein Spith_1729 [Spirochaeta thermophila DSM 6578]